MKILSTIEYNFEKVNINILIKYNQFNIIQHNQFNSEYNQNFIEIDIENLV